MITQLYDIFTLKLGLSPEQARTFICQAAHETGYFNSNVFKNAHNLFGIKSHSRKIEGKKEKTNYNGYAVYENIEASCRDALDIAKRRGTIEKAGNIYTFVIALKETRYFEASVMEYLNGMLAAYRKLFPESKKYEK